MNKALIALALLGLVILAGCSGTTTVGQKTTVANAASASDGAVSEASSSLADQSNNVEIGEMV